MTITEFRDTHRPNLKPEIVAAGVYLEKQGLLFGHDFATFDALDLAAAFLTRKFDDDKFEERVEALATATGKVPYEEYD